MGQPDVGCEVDRGATRPTVDSVARRADENQVEATREDTDARRRWRLSVWFAVVAIGVLLGGIVYAAVVIAEAIAENVS